LTTVSHLQPNRQYEGSNIEMYKVINSYELKECDRNITTLISLFIFVFIKLHVHCYTVTLLHCTIVTMFHCYTVRLLLLYSYTVTLLQCYTVTLLHCTNVTMFHCYTVTSQNVLFVIYVLYVKSKHKIVRDGHCSALLMKCVYIETAAAVRHYA
jgi:hypothetical protein